MRPVARYVAIETFERRHANDLDIEIGDGAFGLKLSVGLGLRLGLSVRVGVRVRVSVSVSVRASVS